MKYYTYATALILAAILIIPLVSANHVSIDISRVRKYGPQNNGVIQVQTSLGSTTPMWLGLQAGDLDFGEWPITRTQLDEYNNQFLPADVDGDGAADCRDTVTGALSQSKYKPGTDPVQGALCLVTNNEFGMFVLDINNQRPTVGNPTNPGFSVNFRRAMAHLEDMANLVTNVCGGLCTDIQGIPLPNPAMADWRSASAAAAFPKLDATAAWNELQAGGIVDVDGDGILEMDLNNDGTTSASEEPIIVHYGRLDVNRSGSGRALRDKYAFDNPSSDPLNIRALFGAGFRYDYKEVTFATVFQDVFDPDCDLRKHTLYQGGWGTGISPDLLFFLYHPFFNGPGLTNYNCVDDAAPGGLNERLEAMFFAPDAVTALAAIQSAQDLWAQNVYNIGLWSAASRLAYRAVLRDVVNFKGSAEDTFYSHLTTGFGQFSARPWNLRWNAINPPESLNVVYSSDLWGGFPLGLMYDSLIAVNPNKPTILGNEGIMNWMAKRWTIGTYSGATPNGLFTCATTCDVLTFELDSKHPILFQDGTQMTAEDVAFSFTYLRDSVAHGGFVGAGVFDVVDTTVSNSVGGKFYTASIYYDARSFFHLVNAGIPMISKAAWQSVPFANPPAILETAPASPSQGAVTGQIGTGPFKLVNWDPAAGTAVLERHNGYFKSSALYDSFHASGNVNGLSPDMVSHLQTAHGLTATYSVLADNSNKIDVLDLVSIGGNFGKTCAQAPKADLNEDCVVNILDLVRVGGNMFKDLDHGDWTTFPSPAGHPIAYA